MIELNKFTNNYIMKKVALLLRGISYMKKYIRIGGDNIEKYIDYRITYDSIKTNIIQQLQSSGYDVDIFISTYNSELNEQLLSDYKPKKYTFIDFNRYNHMNRHKCLAQHICNVIDLLQKHINETKDNYDFVIVTRFDTNFGDSIMNFNFNPTKFNFGNTALPDNSAVCADLIILNTKYLDAYKLSAKNVLKKKIKHMHQVYNIIGRIIGKDEINFCFYRYIKKALPYNIVINNK